MDSACSLPRSISPLQICPLKAARDAQPSSWHGTWVIFKKRNQIKSLPCLTPSRDFPSHLGKKPKYFAMLQKAWHGLAPGHLLGSISGHSPCHSLGSRCISFFLFLWMSSCSLARDLCTCCSLCLEYASPELSSPDSAQMLPPPPLCACPHTAEHAREKAHKHPRPLVSGRPRVTRDATTGPSPIFSATSWMNPGPSSSSSPPRPLTPS